MVRANDPLAHHQRVAMSEIGTDAVSDATPREIGIFAALGAGRLPCQPDHLVAWNVMVVASITR